MAFSVPNGSLPSSVYWEHHLSCLVRLEYQAQGQSQGARPGSGPGPRPVEQTRQYQPEGERMALGSGIWKPAALTGGPPGLTILMESQLSTCCRQEQGRGSETVLDLTTLAPLSHQGHHSHCLLLQEGSQGDPKGILLGSKGLQVPSPSTSSSFQVIGAEGDCWIITAEPLIVPFRNEPAEGRGKGFSGGSAWLWPWVGPSRLSVCVWGRQRLSKTDGKTEQSSELKGAHL